MLRFGIDRLIDDDFTALKGQRVGLFTNLSAVNRDLVPTYEILRHAEGVKLNSLFSPEHGLAGMVADGVAVASGRDARTWLPIFSLYGKNYAPTLPMLVDLDVLVCDIQDTGVRYYTYLWTLTHILEACGAHGLPVLILDRPNPLGGRIDGGGLADDLRSLVGRYPIPIQHGMTLGELASLINKKWNPTPAPLEIIPCDGWRRDMLWDATGRAFIPSSPAMSHFITAQHYPGACLIEGTTLSEGRGTALPFEVVGAPFIDPWVLTDAINQLGLAGVAARPHQFKPYASKHSGLACGGVQLHITDPKAYEPLRAWLAILRTLRQLYPSDFGWLPPHDGLQHFDRLIGDKRTRERIDAGATIEEITGEWAAFQANFRQLRQPFLLYGETGASGT